MLHVLLVLFIKKKKKPYITRYLPPRARRRRRAGARGAGAVPLGARRRAVAAGAAAHGRQRARASAGRARTGLRARHAGARARARARRARARDARGPLATRRTVQVASSIFVQYLMSFFFIFSDYDSISSVVFFFQ